MAASPSPSSDDPFELGSVLDGRYRIDGLLGTGGMGRVYRAEHTKIGKSVAIKVLHADLGRNREASQRFQREAIASGRLDHPNIVGVSDFGVLDDGACYLVMEVLEGESLGDRLARDHRIHWVEAIEIMRGVLNGLRHAHERGVVHRDIKPDNVYLAYKDGDPVIKILDFGIAKLYAGTDEDPAQTRAGLTVGTPAYLSPEQAVGGEITPKSDLYSASILLYEMLAGRAPFEDKDPLAMLGAHVSRRPPPFAEVVPEIEIPPTLEDIMQRGLMKMAVDRIGSASDYLAMLDGFSPPIHAMPRFATSPGLALPAEALVEAPVGAPGEVLGTMATASQLAAAGASGVGRAAAANPSETALSPATPVPVASEPGRDASAPAPVPVGATASGGTYVSGAVPVAVGVGTAASGGTYVSGAVPVAMGTAASSGAQVSSATPVPVAISASGATAGSLPVAALSLEMPKLARAKRAVSLADVVEPIPKTWIVRSGVFVALVIVGAIVLAIATHCGSSRSTPVPAPPAASAKPPAPALVPKAPAPAVAKPAPVVAKPALLVAKPPAATPPAPAPVEASPPPPSAPPVKADPRDPQLKALVRELEGGRTCALRKAAIAKLVALRHPGAIPPLKRARYRLTGGVLGLGQSNINACLTADVDRALKTLGTTAR
jgi:Protein kinase domain